VETVAPGATMLELHSNFTFEGSKETIDGVRPTNHAWHENVEINRRREQGARLEYKE